MIRIRVAKNTSKSWGKKIKLMRLSYLYFSFFYIIFFLIDRSYFKGHVFLPASASKDACLAFFFVPLVAADTEASGVFEMLDREHPKNIILYLCISVIEKNK